MTVYTILDALNCWFNSFYMDICFHFYGRNWLGNFIGLKAKYQVSLACTAVFPKDFHMTGYQLSVHVQCRVLSHDSPAHL